MTRTPTTSSCPRRRAEEQEDQATKLAKKSTVSSVVPPASTRNDDFQSGATEEGKAAQALASDILEDAGFEIVERNYKLPGLGLQVNLVATDNNGEKWYFDVTGAFTSTRWGAGSALTPFGSVLAERVSWRPVISSLSYSSPLIFRLDEVPATGRCARLGRLVCTTCWGCSMMLTGSASAVMPQAAIVPARSLASGPPWNSDLLVDMVATTLAYAVVQREAPEVYVADDIDTL